jgi:hypothetical protein
MAVLLMVLIYGSLFLFLRRGLGHAPKGKWYDRAYDYLQRDVSQTGPGRVAGLGLRFVFGPIIGVLKFLGFILSGILRVLGHPVRGLASLMVDLVKVALPFLAFWALISAIRWAWYNPLF